MNSMRIVGMMSGTSLDGVDAVLAEYNENKEVGCWDILGSAQLPIPSVLKEKLYSLNFPNRIDNELHAAKIAEQQLTHCYAEVYQKLLCKTGHSAADIDAIAAHGQTIRHLPNADFPYTLQLLNGALLQHLTQTTVVCDFRSKDIAAGGQGAPLAPLFHRELFALQEDYAVINIGGISNISLLTKNGVSGFDCGPGNCLLDEWIMMHQQKAFDQDAQWAKQGKILPALLDNMLSDHYFSLAPPKSSGRDYFHHVWLTKHLNGDEIPVDVMRTLVRLTAETIAGHVPDNCQRVILVGGGAKNPLLFDDIEGLLPKHIVCRSDSLGIDSQLVEGLGFAVLGRKALLREPLNTCAVTGAKVPTVQGAIHH